MNSVKDFTNLGQTLAPAPGQNKKQNWFIRLTHCHWIVRLFYLSLNLVVRVAALVVVLSLAIIGVGTIARIVVRLLTFGYTAHF